MNSTQPYFDTKHLLCKNFHFFRRGVQGVPELKRNLYLEIISTRVYKKIFLIKAKNYFVLGVPKVLWEGVGLNDKKKNHMGIRKIILSKVTNFWYGLPEDFFSKWHKANGIRRTDRQTYRVFLVLHFATKNIVKPPS